MDLCVGKPYINKTTGEEKKRWVKVGAMFINHDEVTKAPRYSMKFDAYPTGDVFISAFEKKVYVAPGASTPAAPASRPAVRVEEDEEEEVRLEDIPF